MLGFLCRLYRSLESRVFGGNYEKIREKKERREKEWVLEYSLYFVFFFLLNSKL